MQVLETATKMKTIASQNSDKKVTTLSSVIDHVEDKVAFLLQKKNTEKLLPETTLEIKRFNEITPDEIEELIQCFREDFGYSPWGEYKCCSDENCSHKISIEDYYGLSKGQYVSIDALEEIEKNIPNYKNIPNCDDHKNAPLKDFWDKDKLRKDVLEKFSENGHAVFLKDKNKKIVGYTWGYKGTFHNTYKHEYEKFYKETPKPIENFMKKAGNLLNQQFSMDSEVFSYNMIGIKQDYRSLNNLLTMISTFLQNIPVHLRDLPIPMEANRTTDMYLQLILSGCIDMDEGYEENYTLMLYPYGANSIIPHFCMPPEDFMLKFGAKYKQYKVLQKNGWKTNEQILHDYGVAV